jgi:micrococcal nuclease
MARVVPALLALLLAGCGATFATPRVEIDSGEPTSSGVPEFGEGPQTTTVAALVVDVTDGDTIKVEIDGEVYPLRYIGIDAPEQGAPGAKAATRANRELVAGETVLLEADTRDTDRFDRLLRYVWLVRGTEYLLVNRELVRLGAAVAKAYPPDTAYQELLTQAQRAAKRAEVGLWEPAASIVPLIPPISTPKPGGGNCDPSYPDVCIPRYPPDLDCGDIPFRFFTVRPPDPHGFDAEGDGVGCEME